MRWYQRKMRPDWASWTRVGLLREWGPSSWRTRSGDHVRPPSVLRLAMMSFSAWSVGRRRPSATARMVPERVVRTEGMRMEAKPSDPEVKTSENWGSAAKAGVAARKRRSA